MAMVGARSRRLSGSELRSDRSWREPGPRGFTRPRHVQRADPAPDGPLRDSPGGNRRVLARRHDRPALRRGSSGSNERAGDPQLGP